MAAEDDEDEDVDTLKQKTEEDDCIEKGEKLNLAKTKPPPNPITCTASASHLRL